jgi:hypothetical protein
MKKKYLVLVVYDRFENLKRWLHCWHNSEWNDFNLVVVHNTDIPQPNYHFLCTEYGVSYIQRPNVGYDIGVFQDICLDRLDGFDTEWSELFFVSDDWIPMSKNFLKPFITPEIHGDVGVACAEISNEVKTHIRTSAFLISKSVSKRIVWDVPQITTKNDCYNFEHQSSNAFYEQIIAMGLKVEMVSPLNTSPIWDIGNRDYLNRMSEHQSVFYQKNKVAIICPIYKSYPQIISSMITQTFKNWELHLVYDGEADEFTRKYVELVNDERIKFVETPERLGNYGHSIRNLYLKFLKNSDCDFILITNGDNYHTPNCLEVMVNGFDDHCVATYCDKMVHSHIRWNIIEAKLALGYIDCASVMIRKDVACSTGWNDLISHSSDWTYFEDVAKNHGWDKFKKVEGCLLIHN